jgi:hypothetical protein
LEKEMKKEKSFTSLIDKFLGCFTKMTKEEADYVETILKWSPEEKSAFMFAKQIFEEKDE